MRRYGEIWGDKGRCGEIAHHAVEAAEDEVPVVCAPAQPAAVRLRQVHLHAAPRLGERSEAPAWALARACGRGRGYADGGAGLRMWAGDGPMCRWRGVREGRLYIASDTCATVRAWYWYPPAALLEKENILKKKYGRRADTRRPHSYKKKTSSKRNTGGVLIPAGRAPVIRKKTCL